MGRKVEMARPFGKWKGRNRRGSWESPASEKKPQSISSRQTFLFATVKLIWLNHERPQFHDLAVGLDGDF